MLHLRGSVASAHRHWATSVPRWCFFMNFKHSMSSSRRKTLVFGKEILTSLLYDDKRKVKPFFGWHQRSAASLALETQYHPMKNNLSALVFMLRLRYALVALMVIWGELLLTLSRDPANFHIYILFPKTFPVENFLTLRDSSFCKPFSASGCEMSIKISLSAPIDVIKATADSMSHT